MRNVKVFAGSSHPQLAGLIMERLSLPPAMVTFKTFPNHELAVDIGVSVRNQDVFIIQSGSCMTNDSLMELLILVHACKGSSAKRITAILPYFPYGKMSKKKNARGSITAKLVANMLDVAGVDHVITMDLHSSQIQGFFSRPVDNLFAEPSIAKFIRERIAEYATGVIVSKNAGGAKRVTSLADRLKMDFALIHKDSSHPKVAAKYSSSKQSSLNSLEGTVIDEAIEMDATGITLVGDCTNRVAFIVDDIIDSPSSFIDAAIHLMKCHAKKVYLVVTHGILSGSALDDIEQCAAIHGLFVTNTYPLPEDAAQRCRKLAVIDVSGVFSEAIRRTHNGESISYLFDTAV